MQSKELKHKTHHIILSPNATRRSSENKHRFVQNSQNSAKNVYVCAHIDIHLCILVTARQFFCFMITSVECYALCVQIMPLFHNFNLSFSKVPQLYILFYLLYQPVSFSSHLHFSCYLLHSSCTLTEYKMSWNGKKGTKLKKLVAPILRFLLFPSSWLFCLYFYFFAGSLFLYRL